MGGETCTVLRLRLMHKLAMSHIGQHFYQYWYNKCLKIKFIICHQKTTQNYKYKFTIKIVLKPLQNTKTNQDVE